MSQWQTATRQPFTTRHFGERVLVLIWFICCQDLPVAEQTVRRHHDERVVSHIQPVGEDDVQRQGFQVGPVKIAPLA